MSSKMYCSKLVHLLLCLIVWMTCASLWMVRQGVFLDSKMCLSKASIPVNRAPAEDTVQIESLHKKKLQYYSSKIHKRDVDILQERCTLLMLTFNRTQMLPRILTHYCKIPFLQKILVIWNDVNNTIPTDVTDIGRVCNSELKFIISKENKLTNRFIPRSEIETDCKFFFVIQYNYIVCAFNYLQCRDISVYICVYMHICVCIYIYIHIYICSVKRS